MLRFVKKISAAVLIGVGFLIAFLSLFVIGLPNIAYLKNHNPDRTRFMELYIDDAAESNRPVNLRYTWVPASRISPSLKKAVLIAEDDTFFEHDGFNWESLKKALERNWQKRSFVRGGSTITQQLVKNLYLSPSKNPFRKLREAVITFQMENTLPKERILELYLNVIEWGDGVYGAEAAAQAHFGKSARNLSAREAAYLAAIIPNPKLLKKPRYANKVNRRVNWILRRMGQ